MGQRLQSDEVPHRPETELILSLEADYVVASWPDTGASVRLGTYETVMAVMADFLLQCAVADDLKRLVNEQASRPAR